MMKVGDALINTVDSFVRDDPSNPLRSFGKYPRGSIFILLDVGSVDDEYVFHHKVLAPDGIVGWIAKKNVKEMVNHETR